MKTFKRFAALLIAAMMVIGTVVPAMASSVADPDLTITFDVNGTQTTKAQKGNQAFDPAQLASGISTTVNGYNFYGWTDDASYTVGQAHEKVDSYTANQDTTFKAILTPAQFTIKYNENKPSAATANVTDMPNPLEQTITLAAGETDKYVEFTAQPKLDGYDFAGWALVQGDTTAFPAATIDTKGATDYVQNVYAIWTTEQKKEVTLYFNGNEPEGRATVPAAIKVTLDPATDKTTVQIPEQFYKATLDGYTFLGWYDQATGGSKVTSVELSADKTVYAHWDKDDTQVTVTYVPRDGKKDFQEKYTKADGTSPAPITLPTDYVANTTTFDGYKFVGWATTEDATTANAPATTDKDITLYGIWTKTIKVTFDPNTGVYTGTDPYVKPVDITKTVTIPTNADTKQVIDPATNAAAPQAPENYYFAGWTKTNPATVGKGYETVTELDIAKETADVTLYATWLKNPTEPDHTDADGTKYFTISVNQADTHQYTVYQVLTGTMGTSSGDENRLGDPKWGESIYRNIVSSATNPKTVFDFIDELNAVSLDPEKNITDFLKTYIDNARPYQQNGQTVIVDASHSVVVPAGYYILVDTTANLSTSDARSLNIVQVVANVTVNAKKEVPELDKKIVNDTLGKSDGKTNDYNPPVEANGISIGDTITFELSGLVPDRAVDYDYYYFVINDTISKGLTYIDGSIVVYKDGAADGNELPTTEYTFKNPETLSDGSTKLSIALKDAKKYHGKNIYVRYKAKLNKDAVIGNSANTNTADLTFSNNPDTTYVGTSDSTNPGFPANIITSQLGITPSQYTKTYATEIKIKKVDESGKPLTGATFEIKGDSVKSLVKYADEFVAKVGGGYWELANGKYTATAPILEDKMDPITGTIDSNTRGYVEDSKVNAGDPDVVVIGNKKYRPYVYATDGTNVPVYVLHLNNKSDYAQGSQTDESQFEKKSTRTFIGDSSVYIVKSQEVDVDGIAEFLGLGAGTYTITETVAPDGFNKANPITFTVEFDENGNKIWSISDSSFRQSDGIFEIEIVNRKGTQLPETGGIGTTIFYMGGAILVLLAGVLLVSKRRMA